MRRFLELFETLDATTSTKAKVNALKSYFDQVPPDDAAWALFFLSGNRLKRVVSSRKISEWCLERVGLPDWLFDECYASVGDTAETVALLLPSTPIEQRPSLRLSEWMEKRILPLSKMEEGEQKRFVNQWWDELSGNEKFILNKILTGSFRVGVSALLTLRGLSLSLKVPTTDLALRLSGDWQPSAAFFESLPHKSSIQTLNPYPFYLASPLGTNFEALGNPEDWLAEWKWDGIRAQAIGREEGIAIWSRGHELISTAFPEIIEDLQHLPKGFALDGELIVYENGKVRPFADLQKRLGRKKVSSAIQKEYPVVMMLYDVLEWEGKDQRAIPLIERRELLQEIKKSLPERFIVSPALSFSEWADLSALREKAREERTEGLMLKKKISSYGVGRQRGSWWKYKVDPMQVDAVLIYAQPGSGQRSGQYTDYTFGVWVGEELVPVAKAYSGLSKEEIRELDYWIRRNTDEKFGPVRKVKPFHVFELAFEAIQLSKRHKAGVALRFPRIIRWRKDKPAKEADTLDNLKTLFF